MKNRSVQVYCIGTAKSGTHSITELFADCFNSAHEIESDQVIDLILNQAAGLISDQEFDRFILERDARLTLDVDSSQLNIFLAPALVRLFPQAKFILTIRHPLSWLDSFINHQLAHNSPERWIKMRDYRFRPDKFSHSPKENILKENGLYTLDGYLSYWTYHNKLALETIPPERLLIIKTDQLAERINDLAMFTG